MVAIAKRMKPWAEKIVPGKQYPIEDAIGIVKQFATAKFDEAVDVSVNLGVDASKSDQQVRGSTVLPHGTGKSVRVAVFAPAGTPKDVVDKLYNTTKTALTDPAVRKRIEDTGSLIVANTPEQFTAQIKAEFEVYKKVVDQQKLKLD